MISPFKFTFLSLEQRGIWISNFIRTTHTKKECNCFSVEREWILLQGKWRWKSVKRQEHQLYSRDPRHVGLYLNQWFSMCAPWTSTSRSLLDTQILKLHSSSSESETIRVGPSNLYKHSWCLDGLPLWLSWWRIRLQCWRPGFDPWVGKIPWWRERLSTPVFWPGEFHGLYSPWVAKSWTQLGCKAL